MGWKILTKPTYTDSANTFAVKDFMRVTESADDKLIGVLIAAAAHMIEKFTQNYLLTQTWELSLDRWQPRIIGLRDPWWSGVRQGPRNVLLSSSNVYIKLTKSPVASITKIETFGVGDAATTFASSNYRLDTSNIPSRIALNDGSDWPADNLRELDAYKVTAVLGYGATAEDIPDDLMTALSMIVFNLYENRGCGEQKIPDTVKEILQPYIIWDRG